MKVINERLWSCLEINADEERKMFNKLEFLIIKIEKKLKVLKQIEKFLELLINLLISRGEGENKQKVK